MTPPSLDISVVSSTDASHSGIGTSTALDYNLASIHKNAVLLLPAECSGSEVAMPTNDPAKEPSRTTVRERASRPIVPSQS